MGTNKKPVNLTVVIPVYNEGENTTVVIEESVQVLKIENWVGSYELLIVNDGSTDNTQIIAKNLAGKYETVKDIHHAENLGFGAALKTGFEAARGKFVSFISGDGEIGIDQALNLLRDMEGADLMVSSRERTIVWYRDVFTWGFHMLTRILTGFNPTGMDGIYVIRREILHKFPLKSNTGMLHLEVLLRCFRKGCKVGYGIMEARPRLSGKSKVTNIPTILKSVWEMITLRVTIMLEGRPQSKIFKSK